MININQFIMIFFATSVDDYVVNHKAADVSAKYQGSDRLLYRTQSQLVAPLIPELAVCVCDLCFEPWALNFFLYSQTPLLLCSDGLA